MCEDIIIIAIGHNKNFSKPKRDEFEQAMIKALKSTKERLRRKQIERVTKKDTEKFNYAKEKTKEKSQYCVA